MYENAEAIKEIITNQEIISKMVTYSQVQHILNNLLITLNNNVEGDIVELGCNVGTTSLFIESLLEKMESTKTFNVYDSFEGLPEKKAEDISNIDERYKAGSCKTSIEIFKENFKNSGLEKTPSINIGWFKDIPDDKYPEKISFAFFDGDFYSSIIDSFEKTYNKLSPGARVVIHDYGWEHLPGVKKACDDFLIDKPEKIKLLEVGIGLLIKE